MRVWNVLSIAAAVLVLLTAACVAQVNEIEAFPKVSEVPPDTTTGEEGRALFNLGIFRRISEFFGWGNGNRKSSQEPVIYRRPEMLPFEVLASENRRSGFNPLQTYQPQQESFQSFSRPKKWTSQEQTKLSTTRKRKRPFNKRTPSGYQTSSFRQPTPFHNSFDSTSQALDKAGRKGDVSDNSMKLDRTGQRDYLFAKEAPKPARQLETAKIESREPVVAVYTGGEKQQFSQSERKTDEIPQPVYSKFSLKNYSPKLDTRPVNPYLRDPLYLGKAIDNSQSEPLKLHHDGGKIHTEGGIAHVHSLRPYHFKNHNSIHEPPVSSFSGVPTTMKGTDYGFFSMVPSRGDPFPANSGEKEKGFFDNVSSFANNFFGKLLPKSSSISPRFKRRHKRPSTSNINLAHRKFSLPPNLPSSNSKERETTGDRYFDPSPQQGIIAKDVFQPIFVPSYSMDENLPTDAMKPLILPQERRVEVAPAAPSQPEMIDFF